MQPSLTLATLDDAADLLAWRNDAVTRAQSRQGGVVGWDDHCRWLERMLGDSDCLFLVGRIGGERCGVVRFNRNGDSETWEVSIALAPGWRGRGIGRLMLRDGIVALRTRHPLAEILAAVRPGNAASAALFLGCGFEPVPSDEEFAHYRLRA